MEFGAAKDHGHTSFFTKLLHVAMVRNFEVLLGQTVNHPVYNSGISCSVIFLKRFAY
jgi:hypothetical protein